MPDLLKARAYHEQHALKEAIEAYEAFLQNNPNHIDALRFLGLAFAQLGDIERAISCFSKALTHAPHDPLLHHLLGNAYKQTNVFDRALLHYQEASKLMPNNLQAYHNALFYKGLLSLQQDNIDQAEEEFQTLLTEHHEHVGALINLGVIALKRNEGQLAIDYFGKALSFDEKNEEARNNLAATFIHHDRFENALTHYTELLKQSPNDTEYNYNAGVAQMALGHLDKATEHFNTVLDHQPHHFAALTNLAAIKLRINQRDDAIKYLTKANQINPNDKSCTFLLNALTGNTNKQATCPEYAKNLFDRYALNYDQHMRGQLQYALPEHIAQLIHHLFAESLHLPQTLDLGCGTGLCGNVLREVSTHLTGVDISPKMLEQAHAKNLYDTLTEADLISYLENNTTEFELIVIADVLPYFGEVERFFELISKHLSATGTIILTIEENNKAAFQLESTARFSHHPDYIKHTANGHNLNIVFEERIIGRMQDKRGVPVILYAFRLTQDKPD